MKQKQVRQYRTRLDPFADVVEQIQNLLKNNNDTEAKTILEVLQQDHPGKFNGGQLRTLQRRVRDWRPLLSTRTNVLSSTEFEMRKPDIMDKPEVVGNPNVYERVSI